MARTMQAARKSTGGKPSHLGAVTNGTATDEQMRDFYGEDVDIDLIRAVTNGTATEEQT